MADDVEAWLAGYDNPQKPLVLEIRRTILAADRRIGETIKWQTPTFVYKGNLASFQPRAKKFASLLFHTGASIAGDFPMLEGGVSVARYMRFSDLADVAAKAPDLRRIVKAWCDQRDAG
ncbi:MAG: DUF1801 domain-containing protein [Bauldia sp.]|nr:DUF1801 domain-containing protein [Bauldia sp.]